MSQYEPPPINYDELEPPPDVVLDDPWAGMPPADKGRPRARASE